MLQLTFPMYQLLLLVVLLGTSLLAMLRMKGGASNSRLPPSPPGLPIIGNLHQLGSLPHRSLGALSEKYGPLMLLRLGRVPTLVVSSADAARAIMRTHDLVFASRPSLAVARILFHENKNLAFAPYGEYWRQVRKISVTHLLSNKMVQAFSRMREEEVAIMINKISSQAEASDTIIDMSEMLYAFTNDVLCRVVSGKFSVEAGRNRVFRQMIEENSILLAKFHIKDYLPSLGWLDVFFGLTARTEKNRKRWDDVLDELISDRAGRLGIGDRTEDGGFVDVLLSLQDDPSMDFSLTKENIKALLVAISLSCQPFSIRSPNARAILDMFAAGTDTSYIFLEWAMTVLVRNPKCMKKLQDEVRKVANRKNVIKGEDLSAASYLKAVLMEILRLHPPVPLLLPRESMEDCEIQGYKVSKQTRVIINFWAIGRDPKSWERPEEFLPERFMDNPVDFKGNDFQFIPFGAGRRICPGMNFAVATAELALANLVHKFDWELPTGMKIEDIDMAEAPGLTTRKKQRLHLIARPCMC